MPPTDAPWAGILEDARRYPSPHNSQPIKVRVDGDDEATVFYDLDLGLPAESFGIPFAHVCAGVFLESLRVVAAARGFRTVEDLDHAEMDFASTTRLHRLAVVRLSPHEADDTDREAHTAFIRRRTSRRPYNARPVPVEVLRQAESICASAGYRFRSTDDPALVRRIVRVNQATLFDDLRNDAVYAEIMAWLRFSKEEAALRADGLSAETMLMPGRILRFALGHRRLWDAPVLGAILRAVYLRTMRGVHQLGWIEGPFDGPADYVEAGRTFMRLWLGLTRLGVVLHPFGTVITNPRSHAVFAEAVGADERDGEMAWMLFRFGYSARPPLAHRRRLPAMLVGETS
ncbi:hypothetical protein GCM10027416_10330 [Okibacterium endophyticum]